METRSTRYHAHSIPRRQTKKREPQNKTSAIPKLTHYKDIQRDDYCHLPPPALIKEGPVDSIIQRSLLTRTPSRKIRLPSETEPGTSYIKDDATTQHSPRKKLVKIHPKRLTRVIGNGLCCRQGKNRLAGEALFSRVHIQEGHFITEYAGKVLQLSPKDKHYYKTHFHEATHFASLDSMTVIDGYKKVSKGMHAGSKANDSTFRKLLPADKQKALEANAKIVRYHGKLYLQATKTISPYQEIYWEYGVYSYIEPAEKQGVMPTREKVAESYLKQYFCPTCGVAFKKSHHLESHQSVHRTTKDFACDRCKKTYTRQICLDRHIRQKHQKPTSIQRRNNKLPEQSKHTGAFLCDFCGKHFNFGSNLQKHLLLHADIKKYQCAGCGMHLSQSSNLKRHQKTCKKMNATLSARNHRKCSLCPFTTLQKSNLNRHMVNCHNQKGSHVCTQCSKTFTSPSALATHTWSHEGKRLFPCSQCGKSFAQSQGLSRHIKRLHTNKRPHQCNKCPKNFVCASDLQQHMRTPHKRKR